MVTKIRAAEPGERAFDRQEDARAYENALKNQRQRQIYRVILGFLGPLVLLALWELVGVLNLVDVRFIPRPSQVAIQMASDLVDGSLLHDLSTHGKSSLTRWAPGFIFGSLFGLLAGLLMGIFEWLNFSFGPVIAATFPIPKIAIYPLLIVIFGIGNMGIIVAIIISVFFMLVVNTVSGVVYSNPVYRDFAKAFDVPKGTEYFKIVMPGALPSIMAGLRLGFGVSLLTLVATEFVGAQDGMGYYIWSSWQTLDLTAMFAGIIIISLFGVAGNAVIRLLEVRAIPWANT